jgi:hypothetical protein
MKNLSALLLTIAISACGSGGLPEENTTDADVQASGLGGEVDAWSKPIPPATCDPEVFIIGGVPFGPAPPDVSNCPCGIGCVNKLAPDCKGYYCEHVCLVCP